MTYPTKYSEVNALADDFFLRVSGILRKGMAGFYLCGSVALGDFVADRSDVDVVIVTAGVLTDEQYAALEEMHTEFAASGLPLADVLEGSYVPLEDLRHYQPDKAVYPRIDCGQTLRVEHSNWWVFERHILREQGIVMMGPPPGMIVAPVSPGELRVAATALLHQHWKPKLTDTTDLEIPGYRVYAVLTMCRILYTLQYGMAVSKSTAATWVQGFIDGSKAALVREALEWRNGQPFNHLDETLDLIRYTLEHHNDR